MRFQYDNMYKDSLIFRHSTRKSPTRHVITILVISEMQKQRHICFIGRIINNLSVPRPSLELCRSQTVSSVDLLNIYVFTQWVYELLHGVSLTSRSTYKSITDDHTYTLTG